MKNKNKNELNEKEKIKQEEKLIDEASNENETLLLGNRIKELEEKLVRNQAELINYKKRIETETSRMLKYCNEDIILDIISIVDNFDIALKNNTKNPELEKYLENNTVEGLNTLKTVLILLKRKNINIALDTSGYSTKINLKLLKIVALNKEFDATYHQAVMTEHKENVNPGIVIEILQKGYTYKDKVIRHAMVKVSC